MNLWNQVFHRIFLFKILGIDQCQSFEQFSIVIVLIHCFFLLLFIQIRRIFVLYLPPSRILYCNSTCGSTIWCEFIWFFWLFYPFFFLKLFFWFSWRKKKLSQLSLSLPHPHPPRNNTKLDEGERGWVFGLLVGWLIGHNLQSGR